VFATTNRAGRCVGAIDEGGESRLRSIFQPWVIRNSRHGAERFLGAPIQDVRECGPFDFCAPPGSRNLDASLFKDFHITERRRPGIFALRAFNLTNTPDVHIAECAECSADSGQRGIREAGRGRRPLAGRCSFGLKFFVVRGYQLSGAAPFGAD